MEKQFYWIYLKTCGDPEYVSEHLRPTVTPRQKLIYSTNVHLDSRSGGTFLIVTMDSKYISRFGYNYATEILTGIKIPILGYGEWDMVGRIKKPFAGAVSVDIPYFCGYRIDNPPFSRISSFYYAKAEMMKEYINDHKDKDGSYTTFTKELQKKIADSYKNFAEVKVPEPEKPVQVKIETPQDVYDRFVRTRVKSNNYFFNQ